MHLQRYLAAAGAVALLIAHPAGVEAVSDARHMTATVRNLYLGYARNQPRDVLGVDAGAVFAPELLALIRADRALGGEMLDFDPFCDCRAPAVSGVAFSSKPPAPGDVSGAVTVDFLNAGEPASVTLDMRRGANGEWRVADVRTALRPSLVVWLRRGLGLRVAQQQ